LVMQAVGAVKLFTGEDIGEIKAERAYLSVLNEKRNIVLIGMPSSGKTTVAKSLAKILDRDFIDTDDLIVENAGKSITDIFSSEGEAYFRNLESEVIKDISLQTGCVIATGGGAVLREKNVDFLKANGVLIFLDRKLNELLPTPDRPLATSEEAVKKLYHERLPVYSSACDRKVVPSGSSENTAKLIINLISGGEI
ncbi:MAG: shikimate kinase, partial [Clostridiales bacterium]|nr:shikimate kinase [Clostridiales bacterium]